MRRRSTLLLLSLGVLVTLALSQLIAQDPAVPSGWRDVPGHLRRGAWTALGTERAQDSANSAAEIHWSPGTSLRAQVPSGAGAVDVVAHTQAPFVPVFRDDARAEVRYLTTRAAAVVIAEATNIEASLTPAEDSIQSTVELVVREVLKAGDGLAALTEGHRIRFRLDAGTLELEGRQVTFRHDGETPLKRGATYLYFLFVNPTTFVPPDTLLKQPELVPFPQYQTFEIADGEFKRVWRHPALVGALDAVPGGQALEMIRSTLNESPR